MTPESTVVYAYAESLLASSSSLRMRAKWYGVGSSWCSRGVRSRYHCHTSGKNVPAAFVEPVQFLLPSGEQAAQSESMDALGVGDGEREGEAGPP